jgi:hypothetical protein
MDLAPGMERVVEAGETLVITDQNGQEFAVTGRESQELLAFLNEFDQWFTLVENKVKGPATDAAWFKVKEAYHSLPARIQRELPSSIGGIVVSQH